MTTTDTSFRVDKTDFACKLTIVDGGAGVAADFQYGFDQRWFPLCETVKTGWYCGRERFLRQVLEGNGQSFEGIVSYTFHGDEPEEVPAGTVMVDFLDEEQFVAEPFFYRFVVKFGRTCLNAAVQLGNPYRDAEQLSALLNNIEDKVAGASG